jgi:tetratricopeptide (TPR) repeat protein
MKINIISITTFFLCVVVCSLMSCGKLQSGRAPDAETIRLYVRASDAYAQGRFLEVTELLSGINNFPPALVLQGKAEYFSGDLERAENSFRRVIRLRPSLSEGSLYLARILREKGDSSGASRIIQDMLADNPQDIRALRFSAELASDAGRFDETIALLDRAAEYSAESALVLLDRARLHWVSGRNIEALQDLTRARAMLPWDTPLSRSITNLENLITEVR